MVCLRHDQGANGRVPSRGRRPARPRKLLRNLGKRGHHWPVERHPARLTLRSIALERHRLLATRPRREEVDGRGRWTQWWTRRHFLSSMAQAVGVLPLHALGLDKRKVGEVGTFRTLLKSHSWLVAGLPETCRFEQHQQSYARRPWPGQVKVAQGNHSTRQRHHVERLGWSRVL